MRDFLDFIVPIVLIIIIVSGICFMVLFWAYSNQQDTLKEYTEKYSQFTANGVTYNTSDIIACSYQDNRYADDNITFELKDKLIVVPANSVTWIK